MESAEAQQPSNEQTAPRYNEAMLQVAMEKFRGEQNMVGGAIAGLAASLAGAAAWAAITVITDYQIGWMAVGIGLIVGIAMRAMGKGIDQSFGVVGAGLALLGCLSGNVFTILYFVSKASNLGLLETLPRLNPAAIPELMIATFKPIDLLFYGIALYEGYKLSFRRIGAEELEMAVKGVPSGAIHP